MKRGFQVILLYRPVAESGPFAGIEVVGVIGDEVDADAWIATFCAKCAQKGVPAKEIDEEWDFSIQRVMSQLTVKVAL